jgi:transposase InsO family protein
MYLLVIDYFSRYIEIAKLFNTSSQSVINHLKSIFARHGIPECFMSDGGPQYVSFVFKQFAQLYGFQHIVSSPRYVQSNGLAERGVQTIKMMLKKSDESRKIVNN